MNQDLKKLLFLPLISASLGYANSTPKPNFIVINIDDLGWNDVQCMPETKSRYFTPNIEKLAKSGMVFTDGYSACPVCSPARASIITGKTTAALKLTAHIAGNPKYVAAKTPKVSKIDPAESLSYLPLNEVTFAEILKKDGYKTGFIGKWHLAGAGGSVTPEKNGMMAPEYHPEHQGFDINIGGCAYGAPRKNFFSPYHNGMLPDGPKGEYLPERIANEAQKYIKVNHKKPFLLYLNPYSVHVPLSASKESIEVMQKKWGKKKVTYAAMVYSMDLLVGKVINTVEQLGIRNNTAIIFTSDNGGLFGNKPLRDIKGTLYEGGIRVPFIASFPGKIPTNSVSNQPVIGYDIFPTLLELAGLKDKIPTEIDGKSIVPAFSQKKIKREQPLLWHYPHFHHGGMKSMDMGTAIRDGKWKYIYIYKTGKSYLFDLEKDLEEKQNLINNFPEVAQKLQKKMKQLLLDCDANMPLSRNK